MCQVTWLAKLGQNLCETWPCQLQFGFRLQWRVGCTAQWNLKNNWGPLGSYCKCQKFSNSLFEYRIQRSNPFSPCEIAKINFWLFRISIVYTLIYEITENLREIWWYSALKTKQASPWAAGLPTTTHNGVKIFLQ